MGSTVYVKQMTMLERKDVSSILHPAGERDQTWKKYGQVIQLLRMVEGHYRNTMTLTPDSRSRTYA